MLSKARQDEPEFGRIGIKYDGEQRFHVFQRLLFASSLCDRGGFFRAKTSSLNKDITRNQK